jgi:hypothetical protein
MDLSRGLGDVYKRQQLKRLQMQLPVENYLLVCLRLILKLK